RSSVHAGCASSSVHVSPSRRCTLTSSVAAASEIVRTAADTAGTVNARLALTAAVPSTVAPRMASSSSLGAASDLVSTGGFLLNGHIVGLLGNVGDDAPNGHD